MRASRVSRALKILPVEVMPDAEGNNSIYKVLLDAITRVHQAECMEEVCFKRF